MAPITAVSDEIALDSPYSTLSEVPRTAFDTVSPRWFSSAQVKRPHIRLEDETSDRFGSRTGRLGKTAGFCSEY